MGDFGRFPRRMEYARENSDQLYRALFASCANAGARNEDTRYNHSSWRARGLPTSFFQQPHDQQTHCHYRSQSDTSNLYDAGPSGCHNSIHPDIPCAGRYYAQPPLPNQQPKSAVPDYVMAQQLHTGYSSVVRSQMSQEQHQAQEYNNLNQPLPASHFYDGSIGQTAATPQSWVSTTTTTTPGSSPSSVNLQNDVDGQRRQLECLAERLSKEAERTRATLDKIESNLAQVRAALAMFSNPRTSTSQSANDSSDISDLAPSLQIADELLSNALASAQLEPRNSWSPSSQ